VDVGPVDAAAPDGVAPAQPRMRDEIKIYQDSRYVSAFKASHRLYGFDLHKEHPNIVRLVVHLKGRQTILFQEGTDVTAVLNWNPHTTLTTWFAFNKTAREHLNPSAPLHLAFNTLYHDFPRIATWKKKEKQWALACICCVRCHGLGKAKLVLSSARVWLCMSAHLAALHGHGLHVVRRSMLTMSCVCSYNVQGEPAR